MAGTGLDNTTPPWALNMWAGWNDYVWGAPSATTDGGLLYAARFRARSGIGVTVK